MSGTTTRTEHPSRIRVLEVVADGRRRRALAALLDRPTPAGERDLAAAIVAGESGAGESDGDARVALDRALTELCHVHLPALSDAGLVAWDREVASVSTTEHPALSDPRFRRIVETEADRWDRVVDSLAHGHRHAALATVAGTDGPVARDVLARELFAGDPGGPSSPDSIGEVAAALHHVHLPKLADAGLVAYDPADELVVYEGHPELDADLLDATPGEPWIDGSAGDVESAAVHGVE